MKGTKTQRTRVLRITGIIGIFLVAIALVVGGVLAYRGHEAEVAHEQAVAMMRSTCEKTLSTTKAARRKLLDTAQSDSTQEAISYKKSDVNDPSTVDAVKTASQDSSNILSCQTNDLSKLSKAVKTDKKITKQLTRQETTLKDAVSKATKSHQDKVAADKKKAEDAKKKAEAQKKAQAAQSATSTQSTQYGQPSYRASQQYSPQRSSAPSTGYVAPRRSYSAPTQQRATAPSRPAAAPRRSAGGSAACPNGYSFVHDSHYPVGVDHLIGCVWHTGDPVSKDGWVTVTNGASSSYVDPTPHVIN